MSYHSQILYQTPWALLGLVFHRRQSLSVKKNELFLQGRQNQGVVINEDNTGQADSTFIVN